MLLERHNEIDAIDQLLAGARVGRGGALVLRGEPGIGKTALLEYAAKSAADLQVVRAVGVESETQLGFAGLHQLLTPLLARLERLPFPQRRALQSAFGLINDGPPDRFLVGLAVLTLLADAAGARPLLAVVDDTQWLDRESAEALAFVARRLDADDLAIVFATAEHTGVSTALGGVACIDLAGLSDEATGRLLGAINGGPVDDRVAKQLAGETRGNPLAIVELAGELSAAQLAGLCVLPEPLPVGSRLEERFLRRVRELPDGARTLLVIAAAASAIDGALLRRAAAHLGIEPEEAIDGVAHRFLVVDDVVRFRHPLIRSAIYGAATGVERRRAHEALAAASDAEEEADRRAWHRSMAALGPDEEAAAELERSAERAGARGGYAASAALLARAAELTHDPARRPERLVRTARADLAAGAADRAQARLDEAMMQLTDARQRAEARRLQGAIEFARGDGANASATLLAAASELAPLDASLARKTLLEAFEAAHWAGRFGMDKERHAVATAARSAPLAASRVAGAEDLLLDGFAELLVGRYAAGAPLLRRAITRLLEDEPRGEDGSRWLGLGCYAAGELFDEEPLQALAGRWVKRARQSGALTMLPLALSELAGAELQAGRFQAAEAVLSEQQDIAAATANAGALGAATPRRPLLMAWRGEADDTRAGAEEMIKEGIARGQGALVSFAQCALAVLELGLGRYEAALASALAIYQDDPPSLGTHVLSDLVEAAIRCERPDAAAAALERLSARALASGTELALGLLARSRALLSQDGAEAFYAEALERLAKTRAVPELGRAHLLYGEWLRRRRRRRDAREQLRLAFELFDSLGASGFAERARVELLATGEHARKREDSTRDDLTAQEARISRLAAEGASNSEIAEQLFISSSTDAYHLRKAFRKLDVSSRTKLAAALSDPGERLGHDHRLEPDSSSVRGRALVELVPHA